jgi:hypothetical protein
VITVAGEHSASQARSKVLFPSEARPRALTSGQLDRRRHVDAAAHPGLDVPWQIGFNVLVHGGGCSSGMELGLIQPHRRLGELEVRAHCVSATRRVFTDSFVRNSASYHVSRPFEYVFPQRLIATHATNVAVSQLGQYRCAVTTAGPRDSRPAQRRRCAVGVAAQTREPAAATWIPLCEIQKWITPDSINDTIVRRLNSLLSMLQIKFVCMLVNARLYWRSVNGGQVKLSTCLLPIPPWCRRWQHTLLHPQAGAACRSAQRVQAQQEPTMCYNI